MTEQEKLLKAIIDKPEDIDARKVYSAWLEKNGQPERAEFVRLQCIRLKLGSQGVRAMSQYSEREKKLLEEYGEQWLRDDLSYSVKGEINIKKLTPLMKNTFSGGFSIMLGASNRLLKSCAREFANLPSPEKPNPDAAADVFYELLADADQNIKAADVRILCNLGLDPNEPISPAHCEALPLSFLLLNSKKYQLEAAGVLLQHGADPNAFKYENMAEEEGIVSNLHAVLEGECHIDDDNLSLKMMKLLVRYGAHIDSKDKNGESMMELIDGMFMNPEENRRFKKQLKNIHEKYVAAQEAQGNSRGAGR